jgi:cold shock CspA family protein
MAKSKETFGKKEKEKKRVKERQDKAEKMQKRNAEAKKGKSLEEMMAYVDENGNLSSTPMDPKKKKLFRQEDMQIKVLKQEELEQEDPVRAGTVTFFNHEKGFGFINDQKSGERIFVHAKQLTEEVQEGDKVSFEVEMGPKGPSAFRVKRTA